MTARPVRRPSARSIVAAARPLLAFFPRCGWHPTVAPLESCGECRRWEAAQRVLEDADALLGGGRDA